MQIADLVAEASRQLSVCNSCRYCEGYCAVFPALERRSAYGEKDALYLANLCHDCRACYQACMYTQPHELAIDIPRLMSELRSRSYGPRRLGGPLFAGLASLLGVVAFLALVLSRGVPLFSARRGFYEAVPYLDMLLPALAGGLFVVAVWAGGAIRLWRSAGRPPSLAAWAGALRDGVELTYLRGGGPGCDYPDEQRPSKRRLIAHQLVAFGFAIDFVATVAAGVEQDLLGIPPPYAPLSVPVVLGTLGGLMMIAGAGDLIAMKLRAPAARAARELLGLDQAFLALLVLVNLSGLALLFLRTTAAMPSLLVLHLGLLFGLYATAPYGKFAHAALRLAALAVNRSEERA